MFFFQIYQIVLDVNQYSVGNIDILISLIVTV